MERTKPLMILFPPLEVPSVDSITKLCELCPGDLPSDGNALKSELEIFIPGVHQEKEKDELETLEKVAELVHKQKSVFPLVNRAYKLALTTPVSVAKNERTFSRLKIVKNCLRTQYTDDRLDNLLMLYCEHDITLDLHVEVVVDKWAKVCKRHILVK